MKLHIFLMNEFEAHTYKVYLKPKAIDYISYLVNAFKVCGPEWQPKTEEHFHNLNIDKIEKIRLDAWNKITTSDTSLKCQYFCALDRYLDFIIKEMSRKLQ